MPRSFLSSTIDWRTALRATARCSGEPKLRARAGSASGERPSSTRPIAIFTRRILVTASSMRDIGTAPSCTSSLSVAKNSRYLWGTMTMSIPALIEVRTSLL